jgi:hypothetical protein
MFEGCMFEARRRPDSNTKHSRRQDVESFRLVELHRLLERGRADLSVELRRLDPRVAEQATELLEIAVLRDAEHAVDPGARLRALGA